MQVVSREHDCARRCEQSVIRFQGKTIRRALLPIVQKAVADRYEVDREIARGGAARIFRAKDPNGHVVALKVLHPELAVSVAAQRFLQEISFLSDLDHPHIARILDSGESDFVVFYVMPYFEGPTLFDHLRRVRRASVSDTLRIGSTLLGALQYAHERGIVHRDVKPDNVVLSETGPVLLDFGIARAVARSGRDRLTRSGFAVGTSSYMSPEQILGKEDIDHRSDLYSLGCVLFECLAGRPPFQGRAEELVLRMHLNETVPDLSELRDGLPESLVETIHKSMARERADRWSDADHMLQALDSTG